MLKNKKTVVFALIAAAVVVLVGGGIYVLSQQPKAEATETADAGQQPAAPMDAQATEQPAITTYDPKTAEPWVVEALRDRVLGDPKAPITILDYSSLTCPHCADFHTKILPQLKKDYIDTGKAKLIFVDFPLNLPALQASLLARCIKDDEAYYGYIDQLFRTQAEWGAVENAKTTLPGTLKFTGLSAADVDRCVDNGQLSAGVLAKLDEGRNKYQIDSTPTFVINDGKAIVKGAETYDHFKAALDPLVK